MSYITAIGTAVPPFRYSQTDLADFMVRTMNVDVQQARKVKAVFRASGIDVRHSVLDAFGGNGSNFFRSNGKGSPPPTSARMDLYRKHALPLAIEALNNMAAERAGFSFSAVTHLVLVSCTGMYAPGLEIDLIRHFGMDNGTERTCIQFMGCYAAFNGLKTAVAQCKANPDAQVVVLCVELCSLHFQGDPSDDNILANALFADGAAAILVSNNPAGKALLLQNFHSDLAPEGDGDMAWSISDFGFNMRLSAYVPDLLAKSIGGFVEALLAKARISINDVRYFAFHPGGRKILESIEEELQLAPSHNKVSYKVLQQYGNMSSATVVFVLKEILDSVTKEDAGSWIFSAAFGPGLTLESALISVHI